MDARVPLEGARSFSQASMPGWGPIFLRWICRIFLLRQANGEKRKSWDDVPDDIKRTFDKLGVPEAERKFLAGLGAQYESEMVYHSIQNISKNRV